MGNVLKINQYRDQEEQNKREEQTFAEILNNECSKKQDVVAENKQEKLREMRGMNQYNRFATEVWVMLASSQTDFRA